MYRGDSWRTFTEKEGSDKVKNPGDADEVTMKDQVVRQVDILDGSVTAIKGSVEIRICSCTRPQQLPRKNQVSRGEAGST